MAGALVRRWCVLLLAPLSLLSFTPGAAAQHRTDLKRRAESVLASLPFDPAQATSLALSPGATRAAYVRAKDGGFCAVIDGIEGPVYGRIGQAGVVFSPDGQHTAYAAEKDALWVVVLDGAEGEAFNTVHDESITFGGAGRLAYVAGRGGKQMVVDRAAVHPAYDRVVEGSITFSPGGAHLAYCAADGGRAFVVFDGVAGPAYESVGPVRFSRDDAHFAYAASDGRDSLVIADGQVFARHEGAASVRPASITFGIDARFAYVVAAAGGQRVVFDGAQGRPYDRVFEDSLTFAGPPRVRLGYVARRGRLVRVVVDGAEVGSHEGVVPGTVRFSPNGRRVAYLVERVVPGEGLRRCVAVDGAEGKLYHWVGEPPVFSADGRHVAYAAERPKGDGSGFESVLVVDGAEAALAYPWIRGDLRFAADGRRIAYLAAAHDARFGDAGLVPRVPGEGAWGQRIVFHRRRSVDHRPPRDHPPPPVKLLIVEEDVVVD